MFHFKSIFYLIFLHFILAIPQINLYQTHEISEFHNELQHDCLHIVADPLNWKVHREVIHLCMSELPSKFTIEDDEFIEKFTFDQLAKKNISSERLYLWSIPIDIIENYQFYLNQLSTLNDSSLGKTIFYNCTLPRFGPKCQYQLYYYHEDHTSLDDIINKFYINFKSNPINLTCYKHLQCNRGPSPICLDWTEICDGIIDCFDGGHDEEQCWELEINDCEDNEYRCRNGQCIPLSFSYDNYHIYDCIDGSDETHIVLSARWKCIENRKPSIACEDMICRRSTVTSACYEEHEDLLLQGLISIENNLVANDCWSAFTCLLNFFDRQYLTCNNFCELNTCKQIINKTCPDLLYFPNFPVLFSDVYFALTKHDSQYWNHLHDVLFYLCYNNSHYDNYFINDSKILLNNMKCIQDDELPSWEDVSFLKYMYRKAIIYFYGKLKNYHLNFQYASEICNRSNTYHCIHSPKCISKFRIMDNRIDCPYEDDEDINKISDVSLMEQLKKPFYKCETSNKYIPQFKIQDATCDCELIDYYWCEDMHLEWTYIHKNILFQYICDGFIDLFPLNISQQNETDETNCEQWECNNTYTRCDGLWNCPNGADEAGCFLNSILNCSSNHHLCISVDAHEFICLSIDKANDGIVDCLGATDERKLCGTTARIPSPLSHYKFYCRNQSVQQCALGSELCDTRNDCDNGDDEQICKINQTDLDVSNICSKYSNNYQTDISKFWCFNFGETERNLLVLFKLHEMMITTVKDQTETIEDEVFSNLSIIEEFQLNCHYGLNLRVWINSKNNLTKDICLCPPSYYGNQCQYQNQRINLIIKFQALSDSWRTLFAIIIFLIDNSDQKIIHSYEQFTYLSIRDCKTKFNINLLYSTRPKNLTKQYAIHIDIYEKDSFIYRGSILLPIKFLFLPVHHLAYLIDIPRKGDDKTQNCINKQCIHGKCIKYSNNSQNFSFCQCDKGWSGKYCTIQYFCTCSNDSLCIGIGANNRSICICPIDKFGPRCLLTNTICQTNDHNSTCLNGGQCIPNDHDYLVTNEKFSCICPKNFSGDRCEIPDTKFIISFNKSIADLSEHIFIHFIEINSSIIKFESTVRSTTFRRIPIRQDSSIIIYWSQSFHLTFIEPFNKTYYLAHIQTDYNQSIIINKIIQPSDLCPNINQLFNDEFIKLHLIRRIKSYHLPCQNQSLNLSCFHDEVHFCLCYQFGQKRLANCFKFNHNMKFNCRGNSECENDGECVQDHPECPRKSLCICQPCFYGSRCQFSTNGFGLSLDAILNYHIQPNIKVHHQSTIVKFSFGLTIIFILAGFVNGILSLLTFKKKNIREVGCGVYLLGSSITTLLITIIFGLKFLILLLSQMNIIVNRSFLSGQCYVIDFFLRIFLNMDQWLNASVAAERSATIVKGARFNKKKSKQAARYVVSILFLVIFGTCIHDPINRHLIEEINNDDDEDGMKKIWCIVKYKPGLQLYNNIIHGFHFIIPFLINIISIIVLMRIKTRQQLTIHPNNTYRQMLLKQLKEHKHLITAPIVLVILGIPRLILTYLSKCMKSANDAWLFLILYFISFIPAMVTFVVFILPSKYYRKELQKTIKEYRTVMRRRLYFES